MSQAVFVEEKPMPGREHPLRPGATIGREGCDVVLQDPEVSRRHATMREAASGAAIEDLGSTNGTFVNDQRIEGLRELSDGDTVRFGNTVWRVRLAVTATQAGEAPAEPGATAVRPAQPEPTPQPPPAPAAAPEPQPAAPVAAAPEPQAAPAPPPAPAPPQPAAPAPPAALAPEPPAPEHALPDPVAAASAGERRGDVPRPPDVAPSAIRRVLPPTPAGDAGTFNPAPSTSVRGSAATRVEATIFAFIVVALTAAGVILYLILYEP